MRLLALAIVLAVAGFAAAALFPETAQQLARMLTQPEATATPSFVREPTPETTAAPTVAATERPAAAAPVAESCPTPAQRQYLGRANELSGELQTTVEGVREAFLRVQQNPLLVFDQRWRREAGERLHETRAVADEMDALEAPPGLEDVDRLVEESAEELRRMADRGEEGLETLDARAASDVDAMFRGVQERFEEISVLVGELCT